MTLRELCWMAEGRCRDNWAHTSSVMALLANVNRDPKKSRLFKPADFDPYAKKNGGPATVITKDNVVLLRRAFVGK